LIIITKLFVLWLSNFDRSNQRSFNRVKITPVSDAYERRSEKSAYTILISEPHLLFGPEKIGPDARHEGAAPYGVRLPVILRKSLQVPWAHLARLDNRHTGAFIMNGSSVSILFSPPFILLARALVLSRPRPSLPETNTWVSVPNVLSLHTLITAKGLARELFFRGDRAGHSRPSPSATHSPFILRNSIPIPECRIESH